MDIISLAGCAVICCVLIIIVRHYKPEIGVLISMCAGAAMLWMLMSRLAPVLDEINSLVENTRAAGFMSVVLKALGICVVSQVAADICRDSGQQTLAVCMETAGKVAILVTVLPMFSSILSVANEIIYN